MNEYFEAFGRALRGVLTVLVSRVFIPVNSHVTEAWEDLENWLVDHRLTIHQIAGYFLLVAFGFMALGGLADMVGVVCGQIGHMDFARGVIALGTLLCFAGALPLLVLLNTAKGLFDLVVRGGEAALEVLESDDNKLPRTIRCQLEGMRNRRNMSGTLKSLYATYAALTVSLLCWPNFHGFYGIVVAAVAVSGIVTLRKICDVRGHGVTRLMMAGCYGFAAGNIVFLIFYVIAKPLLLWGWADAVSENHAFQFSLIAATIAALITFFYQNAHLRLGAEEKELRNGKTKIRPFELEVDGVDETTGKPNKFKKVEAEKGPDYIAIAMDWAASAKLWFLLAVIAWAVWTFVLGRSNPLANIDWFSYQTLIVLVLICAVLAWLFGRTEVVEVEEEAPAKPQQEHKAH